jgi:hypothetical protein
MFLKSSATMVEFSAAGDAALMQLGDKNLLSSLALERIHGFTLGASFAQAHPWGKGRPGAFDLSSAALADRERIWGLLNDGRILSAANGAEAADVQLYSGNSLEGQPAIYFGLCPTGVVAIGDGIVAAPRPAPAIPEE